MLLVRDGLMLMLQYVNSMAALSSNLKEKGLYTYIRGMIFLDRHGDFHAARGDDQVYVLQN